METMNYKDVLYRIGYFRNKNNLSARETSLRLGASEGHFNRIERGVIELKVSTLLEFLEMIEITPSEFFYSNPERYKDDKELLDVIKALSPENRKTILNLAQKLK